MSSTTSLNRKQASLIDRYDAASSRLLQINRNARAVAVSRRTLMPPDEYAALIAELDSGYAHVSMDLELVRQMRSGHFVQGFEWKGFEKSTKAMEAHVKATVDGLKKMDPVKEEKPSILTGFRRSRR